MRAPRHAVIAMMALARVRLTHRGQLSLLHELVPNAAVIALLVDVNVPEAVSQVSEVQAAARTLGLQLVVLNARTASDIDMAFASLCGSGPVRSSSAQAVFLSAGAIKSLRSRRAMRFPRFMDFVSIPPTAAWSVTETTSGCLSPSGRLYRADSQRRETG